MTKYRVRINYDEIIEAEDVNDAWFQFRNMEDLDLKVEEVELQRLKLMKLMKAFNRRNRKKS